MGSDVFALLDDEKLVHLHEMKRVLRSCPVNETGMQVYPVDPNAFRVLQPVVYASAYADGDPVASTLNPVDVIRVVSGWICRASHGKIGAKCARRGDSSQDIAAAMLAAVQQMVTPTPSKIHIFGGTFLCC